MNSKDNPLTCKTCGCSNIGSLYNGMCWTCLNKARVAEGLKPIVLEERVTGF